MPKNSIPTDYLSKNIESLHLIALKHKTFPNFLKPCNDLITNSFHNSPKKKEWNCCPASPCNYIINIIPVFYAHYTIYNVSFLQAPGRRGGRCSLFCRFFVLEISSRRSCFFSPMSHLSNIIITDICARSLPRINFVYQS